MDPEQLLLESCRDIEARLQDGTLYALVKATGVLWLLLVDDTPLVHHVNRIHRLKLQFTVIDSNIDWDAISKTVGISKPDMEFLGDQFDGVLPPGLVRRTVTLDQFLDLRFGRVKEATFSVRRVIQFMANVQGGVHLSKPDEKQKLLIDRPAIDLWPASVGRLLARLAWGRPRLLRVDPELAGTVAHAEQLVLGVRPLRQGFTAAGFAVSTAVSCAAMTLSAAAIAVRRRRCGASSRRSGAPRS